MELKMKKIIFIIIVIPVLYFAFKQFKYFGEDPNDGRSKHNLKYGDSPTHSDSPINLLFKKFALKNFQQKPIGGDQAATGNKTRVLVCEQLLTGFVFNFSQDYFREIAKFHAKYLKEAAKHGNAEGFSSQVSSEALFLHLVASLDGVETICETGFNYGHSSFNFLTAKSTNKVYSFDLGSHGYSRPMAEYLSKAFPGRHRITFGDSTITVPIFVRTQLNRTRPETGISGNSDDEVKSGKTETKTKEQEGEKIHCDLIFVDGGHVYNVAKADLKNLAQLGIAGKSLVIFDDYPTNWGAGFGKAWEEEIGGSVDGNRIRELMRCTSTSADLIQLQRGFTIGLLLKN